MAKSPIFRANGRVLALSELRDSGRNPPRWWGDETVCRNFIGGRTRNPVLVRMEREPGTKGGELRSDVAAPANQRNQRIPHEFATWPADGTGHVCDQI